MNNCGKCTACCTVLGVQELKKPEYQPCTHLCETGCSIYGGRPKECQTYECFWLATNIKLQNDDLPVECRPDKIGVILEVEDNTALGGIVVTVREVWPGASDSRKVKILALKIAHPLKAAILIISDGGRRFVFPKWAQGMAEKAQQIKFEYEHETGKTDAIAVIKRPKNHKKEKLRAKHKQERRNRRKNRK